MVECNSSKILTSKKMSLFILTLFLFIFLYAGLLVYRYLSNWLANGPPLIGAFTPLLGCTLSFMNKPHLFVRELRKKHGELFTMQFIGGLNITMGTYDAFANDYYKAREDDFSFYGIASQFFKPLMSSATGSTVSSEELETQLFSASQMKALKALQTRILPSVNMYIDTLLLHTCDFTKKLGSTGKIDFFKELPSLILTINSSCIVARELGEEPYREKFVKLWKDMETCVNGKQLKSFILIIDFL